MKKITYIIAFAAMALTWTSCDKDKDEVKPVTKTDLLTAHPWRMTGFRIDPPIVIEGPDTTVQISDFFEMDECWHDNTMTFFASGDSKTYTENEGANNCNEGDPAITTGTWSFNSTETSITLDSGDGDPQTAIIDKLTETTLEFSQPLSIVQEEFGINWTGKAYATFQK